MRMVPECAALIGKSSNDMACWLELHFAWPEASLATRNKIMKYSRWCWDQGGYVASSVECAFIEHITEDEEHWPLFFRCYDDNAIRAMMPLWEYNYRDRAQAFVSRLLAARSANA